MLGYTCIGQKILSILKMIAEFISINIKLSVTDEIILNIIVVYATDLANHIKLNC